MQGAQEESSPNSWYRDIFIISFRANKIFLEVMEDSFPNP